MTQRWLGPCGAILVVLAVVRFPSAAEPAAAPLPPDEAVRTMRVPEGFSVTLFAAEPDVVQPISFCLDDRGRLWVAEAQNYGEWQATGRDRITILEDTNGDGRADRRQVFYEGFNYITGLERGFGGVWVISPPGLYFVPDRNADDQPDGPPEMLFDGFGYRESRHNLANGFTWGPDGWLYAGHGRTSPSDVGPPGTPAKDRIHCDGGVYRIHPTRRLFENFADGTTNPWGVDFDDYGQCFVSNCVNPHLFHMIQGGHYEPWRNRPSSRNAYDRLPTIADHLHYPTGRTSAMRGETPETLALGGGHAHCGTLVYLGDSFPASYRNSVLMCNVHGRRVNRDVLQRVGSGYTARHDRDFLIAEDPWFMGVTLRTGPEGAVYVSDWSDTGECHTYKPHRDTGRIYRIQYGQPSPTRVDLARLDDIELAQLQTHRNDWHVRHARRRLQERAADPAWQGDAVHRVLQDTLARDDDVPRRLRALWALWVTRGLPPPELIRLLDDPEPLVRAWCIQLLGESPPADSAVARFAQLAHHDPAPVVRLYLASVLQRLPVEQRWEIAQGLLRHETDQRDANLPLMVWYGLEPLVEANPARAIALGRSARVPLIRQHVARRLVEVAVVQPGTGVWDEFVQALHHEEQDPVLRDLLAGALTATRGLAPQAPPPAWKVAYPRLSASTDREVRRQAMRLALVFGDSRAVADLRRTAFEASADVRERQQALATLVEQQIDDLAPDLLAALDVPALRGVALRGLAAYREEGAPAKILERYPMLNPDEKRDAVATLASRKPYATALLDALQAGRVPRSDISAFAARQIQSLGDLALSKRLQQLWGNVRETPEHKRRLIAKYKALLAPGPLQTADRENGHAIFKKTCGQCHQLFGEGGKIGPDLTGANRTNLDYLLANIVDPSAEIGQDFRLSIIHTRDGRVITGILTDRSASQVVVQTATERVTLASAEVESIAESPLSLMPEGQLEQLSSQQIRDLIGYLSGAAASPSLKTVRP